MTVANGFPVSPCGIDGDGDWVLGCRRLPSPHRDDRPAGCTIDAIIVHGISLPPGEFGGGHIEALFAGELRRDAHPAFAALAGLRVSAHLLIARGGLVTQFVPLRARAWHAGESVLGGRPACNDYSVGIELEGTDDRPYTPAQYAALAALVAAITGRYPGITRDRIVGHSDVAAGRKTDPGPAFDWARLHRLLDAGVVNGPAEH